MDKIGKWLFKTIPQIVPDVLALLGAISISYGAFLIYKPLGYIALGVMLISAAVIVSKA